VNALPTFGDFILFGFDVTMEEGSASFGSFRESENEPLADRCLP